MVFFESKQVRLSKIHIIYNKLFKVLAGNLSDTTFKDFSTKFIIRRLKALILNTLISIAILNPPSEVYRFTRLKH